MLHRESIIIMYASSHSVNAIDPAPHRSGRQGEHCSRMFAKRHASPLVVFP
jgi:hypothetical protein